MISHSVAFRFRCKKQVCLRIRDGKGALSIEPSLKTKKQYQHDFSSPPW
jgi:hypothetical protein